jgi:hypothetical protein
MGRIDVVNHPSVLCTINMYCPTTGPGHRAMMAAA